MRYASVSSTTTDLPRLRRRLGFLVWSKCLRPARERKTLPVAVILKRLATDFLVLMPFGRLIRSVKRARNIERRPRRSKWYFTRRVDGAHLPLWWLDEVFSLFSGFENSWCVTAHDVAN